MLRWLPPWHVPASTACRILCPRLRPCQLDLLRTSPHTCIQSCGVCQVAAQNPDLACPPRPVLPLQCQGFGSKCLIDLNGAPNPAFIITTNAIFTGKRVPVHFNLGAGRRLRCAACGGAARAAPPTPLRGCSGALYSTPPHATPRSSLRPGRCSAGLSWRSRPQLSHCPCASPLQPRTYGSSTAPTLARAPQFRSRAGSSPPPLTAATSWDTWLPRAARVRRLLAAAASRRYQRRPRARRPSASFRCMYRRLVWCMIWCNRVCIPRALASCRRRPLLPPSSPAVNVLGASNVFFTNCAFGVNNADTLGGAGKPRPAGSAPAAFPAACRARCASRRPGSLRNGAPADAPCSALRPPALCAVKTVGANVTFNQCTFYTNRVSAPACPCPPTPCSGRRRLPAVGTPGRPAPARPLTPAPPACLP